MGSQKQSLAKKNDCCGYCGYTVHTVSEINYIGKSDLFTFSLTYFRVYSVVNVFVLDIPEWRL